MATYFLYVYLHLLQTKGNLCAWSELFEIANDIQTNMCIQIWRAFHTNDYFSRFFPLRISHCVKVMKVLCRTYGNVLVGLCGRAEKQAEMCYSYIVEKK